VFGTVVHNGVGIARGTISGKLLAELISGHEGGETGHRLRQAMRAKGRPNAKLPFQDLGVRVNARARRLMAGREE
jgi:glycine/D-amino acid oxidase-like deaminating enzyme